MTQENYEYIEFPDGLFGFEQNTKFVPIMVEEDSDAVLLLQSMENEELSFVVMKTTTRFFPRKTTPKSERKIRRNCLSTLFVSSRTIWMRRR